MSRKIVLVLGVLGWMASVGRAGEGLINKFLLPGRAESGLRHRFFPPRRAAAKPAAPIKLVSVPPAPAHPAPVQPVPPQPAPACRGPQDCPAASCCGEAGPRHPNLYCLWQWLTYRPLNRPACGRGCCCGGKECVPCCNPPLYAFFLHRCEGSCCAPGTGPCQPDACPFPLDEKGHPRFPPAHATRSRTPGLLYGAGASELPDSR